uniref:hypothetical protein n=1 Tax=Yoonia sp. TaxID=2212373 RepID=UPI004047A34A
MTRILQSAMVMVIATASHADPDRVSILMGSDHVNAKYPFNEFNPGVFLTWEGPVIDWTLGAYLNSYARGGVSLTASLPVVEWDEGSLDLFIGAALYPVEGRKFALHVGDVVPIGGLQLRQGQAFMQVIPSDGLWTDAIVTFGVTFPLE